MLNIRGFTYSELIVVLVIAAVILLTVSALSSIGNSSYENVRKEAEVYNDIYFGFNLIARYVRSSGTVGINSNQLTAGNLIFQCNGSDFFYHDSSNNSDHTILSGITNLSCSFVFVPSTNNKVIRVTLNGDKSISDNKVLHLINLTTDIMRRN